MERRAAPGPDRARRPRRRRRGRDRLRRDRGHRRRRPVPAHHRSPDCAPLSDSRGRIARRPIPGGGRSTTWRAGTCSVLEHGYLTRVERPTACRGPGRQVRASAGADLPRRGRTPPSGCSSSSTAALPRRRGGSGPRPGPGPGCGGGRDAHRPARVGPVLRPPVPDRPTDRVACCSTGAGPDRPSHALTAAGDAGATGCSAVSVSHQVAPDYRAGGRALSAWPAGRRGAGAARRSARRGRAVGGEASSAVAAPGRPGSARRTGRRPRRARRGPGTARRRTRRRARSTPKSMAAFTR